MNFYNQLKNWGYSNRGLLIGLTIGFGIFLFAARFSKYEVSATMLLMFYTSAFIILLTLFVYFIKGKKVIVANIILLGLLVLSFEVVCFFLRGMPVVYNKNFDPPNESVDHISRNIGTMPFADSVYNETLIKNEDTVFDVSYTINENHIRVTPNFDSSKTKFGLFFGCSIAYGYGLEDNETLPYQFQQFSEKYNSYNYAFNGHGTNHMLARLEYEDLSSQVVETDGVAIYVFFWDHIYRAIGTMDRYCDWLYNAPYYTFEKDTLIRKKMFNNGRYLVSKSYEYLHQLNIIKQFNVAIPSKLNEAHFDLVSEMILKSKETYANQFGNDNFYVAIYPSYIDYSFEEMELFKSYLIKKNINIIDMSNYLKYGSEHSLGGDPHPNSNTNKLVAEELLRQLNE